MHSSGLSYEEVRWSRSQSLCGEVGGVVRGNGVVTASHNDDGMRFGGKVVVLVNYFFWPSRFSVEVDIMDAIACTGAVNNNVRANDVMTSGNSHTHRTVGVPQDQYGPTTLITTLALFTASSTSFSLVTSTCTSLTSSDRSRSLTTCSSFWRDRPPRARVNWARWGWEER